MSEKESSCQPGSRPYLSGKDQEVENISNKEELDHGNVVGDLLLGGEWVKMVPGKKERRKKERKKKERKKEERKKQ